MLLTLSHTLIIPVALLLGIGILLRVVSRICLFSTKARSICLFARSPWLPTSPHLPRNDGQSIELLTEDGVALCGTLYPHAAPQRKGVVLFCHELNGNRFSVTPYIENVLQAGFDLLTFDFRGHGESGSATDRYPTPRITVDNLLDVRSAIDFLCATYDESCRIGIFGMGKGATIALCIAGKDPRIARIILDGPPPEGRLFEKTCRGAMLRAGRSLVSTRSPRYMSLVFKAILYTLASPFYLLAETWRRFVLGFWCGTRFVNTASLVRRVRQPILILHGNFDSMTRADQIHAFRNRMPNRPKVWFVPHHEQHHRRGATLDDCCCQIAAFLTTD